MRDQGWVSSATFGFAGASPRACSGGPPGAPPPRPWPPPAGAVGRHVEWGSAGVSEAFIRFAVFVRIAQNHDCVQGGAGYEQIAVWREFHQSCAGYVIRVWPVESGRHFRHGAFRLADHSSKFDEFLLTGGTLRFLLGERNDAAPRTPSDIHCMSRFLSSVTPNYS